MREHRTYQRILAGNIRKHRLARGWPQDSLANLLPGWTRATVAAVESGHREVSAEEEKWLVQALGVPLTVLLGASGSGKVSVAGELVSPLALRALASGQPNPAPLDELRRSASSPTEPLPYAQEWEIQPSQELVVRAAASGEAEIKVAKKLGVMPLHLATAAVGLWGVGLTEERDRRLAELSGTGEPGRRAGHITRALVRDLWESMAIVHPGLVPNPFPGQGASSDQEDGA